MARVKVDRAKCVAIATLLKRMALPADAEEDHGDLHLPRTVVGNLYFALVAISHQTTPMQGPRLEGSLDGASLRGWDYLRTAFLRATKVDVATVLPANLVHLTRERLIEILQTDRIAGLDRRVALLKDIGKKMLETNRANVDELYEESGGYLERSDERGLLALLTLFEAYRDPVRKKSLYFLSLMRNHGIWSYGDDDRLGPPVDYHEVRGHLRLATVQLTDDTISRQVLAGATVDRETDVEIREAVYDAIMVIARESGYTPSRLHYFFWNLFRSCCSRAITHCFSCPTSCDLPARYRHAFSGLGTACALREHCSSRGKEQKVVEHQCETEYY